MTTGDGRGKTWLSVAPGHGYAESVLNQSDLAGNAPIKFSKPKFVGIWVDMFSISGVNNIPLGEMVTFTWVRDGSADDDQTDT